MGQCCLLPARYLCSTVQCCLAATMQTIELKQYQVRKGVPGHLLSARRTRAIEQCSETWLPPGCTHDACSRTSPSACPLHFVTLGSIKFIASAAFNSPGSQGYLQGPINHAAGHASLCFKPSLWCLPPSSPPPAAPLHQTASLPACWSVLSWVGLAALAQMAACVGQCACSCVGSCQGAQPVKEREQTDWFPSVV